MQEEVKAAVEQIKDNNPAFNEAVEQEKIIQNTLNQAVGDDKQYILHVMFREVFLPWFMNGKNDKYPNVNMQQWRRIAVNPYVPVFIVDENNQVVCEVPPVLDRSIIDIKDPTGLESLNTENERHRLSQVLAMVSKLSERSPNKAESVFVQELSGRIQSADYRERLSYHAACWNEIYEYYGMESPFKDFKKNLESLVNPTETKQPVTQSFTDDPSVEYDLA